MPSQRKASSMTRESESGLPIEPVYGPAALDGWDAGERLGEPGAYPFTRGVYPTMYTTRPWTMRQYAGFGTAAESNARYQRLIANGTMGLSVAFDLPTQMGHDSDAPLAHGEVGKVGVAIDSVEDMKVLFGGIPLDKVSTSMTINAPAALLLLMYQLVGEEQGVPASKLTGTVQNDVLKEYIARGTYIFPPKPSLRLIADIFAYCRAEMPKWNTISISGYHMAEAGASPAQEIAFTLADGIEYVRTAVAAGMDVDDFAPRLSFFFVSRTTILEEVAKFRAARRIWARWLRDVYGAKTDRAQWLRFHTQTAGVSLTAQQPDNNIVRTAIEALAAVLGGTNSLHTNALDEVLALPSEKAAHIALRTQQVIMDETGVTNVADPLGGSWYVEALTDKMEAEAERVFDQIKRLAKQAVPNGDHPIGEMTSGILRGIEDGWFTGEIADAAFAYQRALEKGDKKMVGVNTLADSPTEDLEILRVSHEVEREQRRALADRRSARDDAEVRRTLARMTEVAKGDGNLIEPMLAAARAEATLGEICGALRDVWGGYTEPARF